jgi:2-C-methyl-D-erythritol 4-phosphate cytidylyltransferase / 2-C-methyl-D-erythritol 2,4-cyclodiphosphate synthase
MVSCTVIIPAAGSGSRLGYGIPKSLVPLRGTALVLHSVRAFASCAQIIVAAPPADIAQVRELLVSAQLPEAVVVPGGDSRAESIALALEHVSPTSDVVLVHDAARPFVSAELIQRVLAALADGADAVVPVVPVTDSLKQVNGSSVVAHVDRSQFFGAQTPQGFQRGVLLRGYSYAREHDTLAQASDDVSLMADIGVTVTTVAGDAANTKITTSHDLRTAERATSHDLRTATGTDVHAFSDSGVLALAGLIWPECPALAGHSDGDAALHALCDAFLSAAGMGDLGQQFGVDEPQWAGASGARLLRHSLQLLADKGWVPVSAQVQIIGNRPRFSARRDEAQQLVSQIVGIEVFFSATTTDGLGFLGRAEGIAAMATVMIERVTT